MMKIDKFKIVIIDPSAILCNGLESVLNTDPECKVIAHFSSLTSLADKICRLDPDVILFNPIMLSSYKHFKIKRFLKTTDKEAVIALLYSPIASNILTEYDESIDIFEKPKQIIQKIKFTAEKALFLKDEASAASFNLSKREQEILVSMAQGLKSREIAEVHNISIHTVITHRRNILKKTNIKTISGLTLYAMCNDLLP